MRWEAEESCEHWRIWGWRLHRELVIAAMPVEKQDCLTTVFYVEGLPVECTVELRETSSLLNSIYVGRVERIQKNINAAFVSLGEAGNGYLPLHAADRYLRTGSRTGPLHEGEELLVQVEKEAMRDKLPRLRSELVFAGKYLVVTTEPIGLHWSKRMAEEDRKRIFPLLRNAAKEYDCGVVVRTNAPEATQEELQSELQALTAKLNGILREGPARTCHTCLYRAPGRWSELARDLSAGSDIRIVTDEPTIYRALSEELRTQEICPVLYSDPLLPLYKLHNFETLLTHLRAKRVWLPSGAFLLIEQTAAFVAIDVNTGKSDMKKTAEETFRKVNIEAAREIARQLRLRQLSGTILIDFINMRDRSGEQELLDLFRSLVKDDPVMTVAVDFTKLGILEVTRKKIRRSLAEQIACIREEER